MKTNLLSLAVLGFTLFLFSCDVIENDVRPSSKITTAQATLSDYTAIDASTAFTVYINFSDTEESIEIEANDNLHQYIEVKKENETLFIGIKNGVHIRGNSTLKAYISTKNISGFSASGASRIIVKDPIEESNVNIYLSGASNFSGEINCDQLFADVSGASVLSIAGYSNDFEIEASGASVLSDYEFITKRIRADLSGASNAALTIEDEIDIEASGASILRYKGDAVVIHQDLSGASSIKKM
jgi:hypothetical protein